MPYSYTYEDTETGDLVDIYDPEDDDDDDDELRNARPRRSRRRSRRSRSRGRSRRFQTPPRTQTYPRRSQTPVRTAPRQPVVREPAHKDGYFSIKKDAIAELLPAAGKVWASFLGTPDMPRATGDDVTDRDNAAAHRDSLAKHQQNQTRILALTELAGRALNLFTS